MRKTDDLPVHFPKATALAVNRDDADLVEFSTNIRADICRSRFASLRSFAALSSHSESGEALGSRPSTTPSALHRGRLHDH
jgi:hypothetical protein